MAGAARRPAGAVFQRGPAPASWRATGGLAARPAQNRVREGLGEWAFMPPSLLMVLALVRRFRHQRFCQTHPLIASAALTWCWCFTPRCWMRFDSSAPAGLADGRPQMAGAAASATVWVPLRCVGVQRQVAGEVQAVVRHDRLQVVEGDDCPSRAAGAGHDAGAVCLCDAARRSDGCRTLTTITLRPGGPTARSPHHQGRWATTPPRWPKALWQVERDVACASRAVRSLHNFGAASAGQICVARRWRHARSSPHEGWRSFRPADAENQAYPAAV